MAQQPLAFGAGAAVFFVNGVLCIYAGCVGNGWIGRPEAQ